MTVRCACQAYELDAYRRQGAFGEVLLATMRQAGVTPDSFLSNTAPAVRSHLGAAAGLRAADDA